jgi:hypothetical protein
MENCRLGVCNGVNPMNISIISPIVRNDQRKYHKK